MIELQEAAVTVTDLSGSRTILQPTSLRLSERRIALIGPNGSGKSTLARLLNGLVTPSSGHVLVTPGKSPDSASASPSPAEPLDTTRDGAAVRRLVGFVFTNPSAQLVMPTVLEDVALSLRRKYRRKPERLIAARHMLDRFGIADLAEQSVHSLSGGQQQLLAVAAVLATEPEILIADEPTTLLDLRNSRLISEVLLGLPQQLIVATHDLELAARCDRVIVIEGGRVVRDSAASVTAEIGAATGATATAGPGPLDVIDWYRSTASC